MRGWENWHQQQHRERKREFVTINISIWWITSMLLSSAKMRMRNGSPDMSTLTCLWPPQYPPYYHHLKTSWRTNPDTCLESSGLRLRQLEGFSILNRISSELSSLGIFDDGLNNLWNKMKHIWRGWPNTTFSAASCVTIFFKNGPISASFCLFSFFSHSNSNVKYTIWTI